MHNQIGSLKRQMRYSQVLAKKMIAIMELSQQQLSKQDHYDYGLRSFVIPIARAAGNSRSFAAVRTCFSAPAMHAHILVLRLCHDMYSQRHHEKHHQSMIKWQHAYSKW